MNREFVMLAQPYNPDKHDVRNWWLSEKLDGQRAFWDGGITRGKIIRNIPWANQGNPKRVVGRATGLWSRYANVICAPDWFLNQLPPVLLDGELYLGPGCFQETRSIVSRLRPDARWRAIKYHIFDSPCWDEMFLPGKINNPNYQTVIDDSCYEWATSLGIESDDTQPFDGKELKKYCGDYIEKIEQVRIPFQGAVDYVYQCLDKATAKGGEGLILRRDYSYWLPRRSAQLLKVKPQDDSEAYVSGYTGGLGKYKGMLGALIVMWNDIVFELSGFTDQERMFDMDVSEYAGQMLPDSINHPMFPIGSLVTFKYTGLTKRGVPREARYFRSQTQE